MSNHSIGTLTCVIDTSNLSGDRAVIAQYYKDLVLLDTPTPADIEALYKLPADTDAGKIERATMLTLYLLGKYHGHDQIAKMAEDISLVRYRQLIASKEVCR